MPPSTFVQTWCAFSSVATSPPRIGMPSMAGGRRSRARFFRANVCVLVAKPPAPSCARPSRLRRFPTSCASASRFRRFATSCSRSSWLRASRRPMFLTSKRRTASRSLRVACAPPNACRHAPFVACRASCVRQRALRSACSLRRPRRPGEWSGSSCARRCANRALRCPRWFALPGAWCARTRSPLPRRQYGRRPSVTRRSS
jgi:hypothetical protein